MTFGHGEEVGSVDSVTDVVSERSEVTGWCFFVFGLNGICHTQLAYLSLARFLARLETSQECLVRGARRRARERQTNTTGPSVALKFERTVRDTL